jgi:hypothetical protein
MDGARHWSDAASSDRTGYNPVGRAGILQHFRDDPPYAKLRTGVYLTP